MRSLKVKERNIIGRPSSLYKRLLTVITVIFVFMAAIIAIGILLFVNEHEDLFWHERQKEAVHNAANQIAEYIKKNENTLYWLSRFGYDEISVNPALMQDFLKENQAFLEVSFLDGNGRTLFCATRYEPMLANQFTVRQSQWFLAAKAGENYYSRVQTSPKGDSYLIFSMPFRQNEVLVSQIKMDGLWQKVAGITFGKGGTVYVVSREGQIIAHRDSQLVLANRSIGNSLQFNAIRQATDNEYAGDGENLMGERVKIVSAKIPSTGWIVVAELPEKEAKEIRHKAFLAIPLGLFCLILFSALLFRRILRTEFLHPIELLRAGTARLSRGELGFRHRIPARRDELCQVMEAFNTMAKELEERHAEQQRYTIELADAYIRIEDELLERQKAEKALRELNEELEHRVRQRTASLQQSNKDLLREISERKGAEEARKKLETQLQQSQKMEAIGTLAGGIAHDFNNILGAVIGYAEMIHDDCPSDSTMRNDIAQILKAGNRAKDLVKQILTFSRQAKEQRVPVQPATIIKEALKLLRSSIPTTISIEQHLAENDGFILADPTQIHQILMNLCTNAYHAMELKGGVLTVSLHRKTLTAEDLTNRPKMVPGNYLQLSVKDTGIGMSDELCRRIFDPYFTTKAVGKGTGMGLAMVHGIVQSYGGAIFCESIPGEGSTFHVFLPLLEAEAMQEAENAEPAPRGTEHLLFIDDEEILLDMGQAMLERLGYRVTVENSPLAALAIFQAQPEGFDMVITDQTMPDMTGADLARRFLQIRPDIPIILCTGYSTLISEEEAKNIGIQGFVMKPLARKIVAELIRRLLDAKG